MIFVFLLVAIFASAVFASAETALYAVSPLRLMHGAKSSRRARWQLRIGAASGSYLCALLIGNNFANDAAVHLAGDLFIAINFADPHFMAALVLTPIIFVFGEVLPKQMMLAKPYQRNLILTPILVAVRIVLFPLSQPLALMLRKLGLEEEGGYRRGQLGALLLEGSRNQDPEASSLVAAHRALQSSGQGLEPFVSRLPILPAAISMKRARTELAVAANGLALLHNPDGQPLLLLGSRLARASDSGEVVDSAAEIPQLRPDLQLSEALEQMHSANANFALVGQAGSWSGILDLEDILVKLLSPTSPQES